MDYALRSKLEKIAQNKYEAVIAAAKLARKINNNRLAQEEQLGPDSPMPSYLKKVTVEAVDELSDGKVKYTIRKESVPEEEFFTD